VYLILDEHDIVVGCKGDWVPSGIDFRSGFIG